MPSWIKERKAKDDATRARADKADNETLRAEMLVREEGPRWFRQLVTELTINTESLPEIGLCGSSTRQAGQSREEIWRVFVSLRSVFPRMTHTDVMYIPGSSVIRCHTAEGKEFPLQLCLNPSGSGMSVLIEDSSYTAQEAAEFIVRTTVARVGG
jgi:hypothetical protein